MSQATPFPLPPHLRHASLNQRRTPQKIKFTNPNEDNFERNIRYYADRHKDGVPMVRQGQEQGERVVLLGSGPSLTQDSAVRARVEREVADGAILIACKQAIKIALDWGMTPKYAVSMDPGAHVAKPSKIYRAPGTIHLIATSSDPLVYDYLTTESRFSEWLAELCCSWDGDGKDPAERVLEFPELVDAWREGTLDMDDEGGPCEVQLFHSACGLPNELQLYGELFAPADCMTGGYNVVNRALALAKYMGAVGMILAGVDSGWRPGSAFYADGTDNRPGVDMSDHGVVDGREWMTRPDMLASAVALARFAKQNPVEFIGDVLPAKLVKKDEAFLKQCVSLAK